MKTSHIMLSVMLLMPVTPAVSSQLDTDNLRNLLVQDCGSCHGLTMKGGLGPALLPDTLSGKSTETLVATILEGRPGTAMPPWKNILNQAEAGWMVQQLRQGL